MKKKTTPTSGPYGSIVNLIVDTDRGYVRVASVKSQFRFAVELMCAARLMAKKARSVADGDSFERLAFVTAAVILACSFLEAGLNEFVFLNATAKESPLSDAEKAVIEAIRSEGLRPPGQHTLQLFNMMLRISKKEPLRRNQEPYRAADAVRSLRNLLVHPKPGYITTFSDDPNEDLSQQQPIARQLREYLDLDRSATFPRDILTSKCATWAIRSCESFFREFVKRSGVSPGFLTDGRL